LHRFPLLALGVGDLFVGVGDYFLVRLGTFLRRHSWNIFTPRLF
jgi:hypothetical protein